MLNKICLYLTVLTVLIAGCHKRPKVVERPTPEAPKQRAPLTMSPVDSTGVYKLFPLNTQGGLPFVFEGRAGATGFLLRMPSGQVALVTNGHVCDIRGTLMMSKSRANPKVALRPLKTSMFPSDLCVLSINSTDFDGNPVKLGRIYKMGDHEPAPLDRVYTIGYPQVSMLRMTRGIVTGFYSQVDQYGVQSVIGALSFDVYPGQSGSPVFNDQGEVIGVVFAYAIMDGKGLYVPLSSLVEFTREF